MAPKSKATITDVARAAGVSTATAGRVLGGYGYTSEGKKEQVLKAAQSLGYRPNALARSLITGKTRTLGVVAGISRVHSTPRFCAVFPTWRKRTVSDC